MQFLNFTPQEIKALLFLLIALLIGSGVTIYKKYHPSFAPELILEKPPPVSFENQSQFNEDSKDTESHSQDASPTHTDSRLGKRVDISPHEISKSSIASPLFNQQKGSRISHTAENPLKKKIDLNSASAYQLELLPGIGPVLSLRIINHRETKGKFQKIEDVMKVSGIGPKTFEKIKDFITVK
jgi:comEA protein